MKEISIRELHLHIGKWVRNAVAEDGIVILGRGHLIAMIEPYSQEKCSCSFSERMLVPGFADIKPMKGDVVACISEDRDRG